MWEKKGLPGWEAAAALQRSVSRELPLSCLWSALAKSLQPVFGLIASEATFTAVAPVSGTGPCLCTCPPTVTASVMLRYTTSSSCVSPIVSKDRGWFRGYGGFLFSGFKPALPDRVNFWGQSWQIRMSGVTSFSVSGDLNPAGYGHVQVAFFV